MRDKADDPLDALIDDTARTMTEGAFSIELRTAVRARIGQTPARRRFGVGHAVAATCAAALVLVTLLVVRSVPAPVEDGDGAQAAREPVGATPVAAPPVARAIRSEAMTRGARAGTRTAPGRFMLPVEGDVAEDIEPLIDPITIEPIATIQIAIDVSSGVMPIDIEPLRIEPLRGQ